MYCTACGAKLRDDWRYCSECGAPSATGAERSEEPHPQPDVSAVFDDRALARQDQRQLLVAGLLILIGTALSIVAMFPAYYKGGAALASNSTTVWFNVPTFVGWFVAALLLLGPPRARPAGAGIALGVTLGCLGFYLLDTLTVAQHAETAATGYWLGIAGWVFCFIGVTVAVAALIGAGTLLYSRTTQAGAFTIVGTAIAAVFAAGYALPWVRQTLTNTARSVTVSRTAGTVFSGPARHVAAGVVVMAIAVLIPMLCSAVRPARFAGGALLGVSFPWIADSASKITELSHKPDLSAFSPAQQAVLVGHFRPTASFVVAVVAVGAMLLLALARVVVAADSVDAP